MYSDRVEVLSPGGLPSGISENEYLSGRVSILRNPILGSVFFRLRLIEKFGTGVRRIKSAYKDAIVKPDFSIGENSIQVTLPVLLAFEKVSADEQKILDLLAGKMLLSSSELSKATGFSKDKVIRLAASLVNKNIIQVNGNGRGTKYMLKS